MGGSMVGNKTGNALKGMLTGGLTELTNKNYSGDSKVQHYLLPFLSTIQKTPTPASPSVTNPDAQTFSAPAGTKMVQAKKTILSRSVSSSGDVLGGTTYLS